jgi:glycosyltransferase involved in cell wall biosynthesis
MLPKVSSAAAPALVAPELPVSIVIPLFNEQSILSENIEILSGYFDNALGSGNWLYIFVDNGSNDETANILKQIIQRWPSSGIIRLKNPNYGAALKAGLRAATTRWVYLLDIEQWDLPFLSWAWRNRERYDLFVGSKRADPTLNWQSRYRKLLSAGLNFALQIIFQYSGTDTHGQKLINRQSLNDIILECQLDRGQFDTELILRAMRGGKRLVEAPVEYRDSRPHRNLMVMKIVWNLLALRRLQRVMRNTPFEGPLRCHRFSREDVLMDLQEN